QPAGDGGASHNAERPQAAEKMQRAGKIFEQKTDGDEVEEDAEGARDAVMRGAALTNDVPDRNLDDGRAIPRGQRGNEAVEFSVERDVAQDFAAIGLEGGAEVVDIHAA